MIHNFHKMYLEHPHQYVQKIFHFAFCTSKTYFFYFTHLFLQNTHISLSIIHIYSNKIFFFFLTVNSNRERREKGKESEVKREERKKE